MAKITFESIVSGFKSLANFNANFTAIANELQNKVLYRNNPTGEPNQMENDLDMNSNDILNAAEIDTAQLRLNGSLVTFGSNAIENTFQETEFTSVAGQTVFSVTYTPGFLIVLINGVELADADYTATSGTSVTLASAVVDNADIVTFRAFGSFNVADALAVSNNLSDLSDVSAARDNMNVLAASDLTQIGTATFSSDVYTFTPVSGEFNTLTAGMMVSFSLPAGSSNTTTTPSINYNGTSGTMKFIDGSAFAVGDLDPTYNKQNLLWKYDGTDFLLASNISGISSTDGAVWIKYPDGVMQQSGEIDVYSEAVTTAAGGLFVSAINTYTYEKQFSASYDSSVSLQYNSSAAGNIPIISTRNCRLNNRHQGFDWRLYSDSSIASTGASNSFITWDANGRWY